MTRILYKYTKTLCSSTISLLFPEFRIAELLELGEGVLATEPAEILGEVAHSDVQRCSIEQRPLVLKNLELDEGSLFISDVFLQTGSTFNPSEKVYASFVCMCISSRWS